MEAIILAGGLGTRLRGVVADVPKPMAPVCGRPFLDYILNAVVNAGVDKVVLSVGYKHEVISDYYGNHFKTAELVYSIEDDPLGTGGALRQALTQCSEADVFLLNGDTLFSIDYGLLKSVHHKNGSDVTFSLKEMPDCSRYGTVMTGDNGVIRGFLEKKESGGGLINGGIYCLKSTLFDTFELPAKFSFETFVQDHIQKLRLFSTLQDEYFIDIGVPEDFMRAQRDFVEA